MAPLLWLLAALLLTVDLPVNAQDQVAIQQICDIAAMSPSINRQARLGIAGWCVQWEKRTQEGSKPQEEKKK